MPTLTWLPQGARRGGYRGPVRLFDITHEQTPPRLRPWTLRSRLPGAPHWERYATEAVAKAAAEDVFRNWRSATRLIATEPKPDRSDAVEPRG